MTYKIHIADTTFEIPSDYTCEHWQKIQRFDISQEMFWPHVISEATGMSLDKAKVIPLETQQVAVGIIAVCLVPKGQVKTLVDGKGLIELDKMTFGQFVNLEIFLAQSINKNLVNIVNTLYDTELAATMSVRDIWPTVEMWLTWRTDIYTAYKALFEVEDNPVEAEVSNEDAAHAWFSLIMILADYKFLAMDKVTEKPLIAALNYLAYRKDEVITQQRKLQESKKTRVI